MRLYEFVYNGLAVVVEDDDCRLLAELFLLNLDGSWKAYCCCRGTLGRVGVSACMGGANEWVFCSCGFDYSVRAPTGSAGVALSPPLVSLCFLLNADDLCKVDSVC